MPWERQTVRTLTSGSRVRSADLSSGCKIVQFRDCIQGWELEAPSRIKIDVPQNWHLERRK